MLRIYTTSQNTTLFSVFIYTQRLREKGRFHFLKIHDYHFFGLLIPKCEIQYLSLFFLLVANACTEMGVYKIYQKSVHVSHLPSLQACGL
uniref:Uncharacterized protein n=1 Tax=Anguilla anguilla TaxID=7936 RepID=A0A0E9X8J0_ANGAN